MFLVTDFVLVPEAQHLELGCIRPEALVHLKVEDALTDVIERTRASLAFEQGVPVEDDKPALPAQAERMIALWRKHQLGNGAGAATLRIDTHAFQHLLIPVGHPRVAS